MPRDLIASQPSTTTGSRDTTIGTPTTGTKDQLLDATERLVADQGVDGASVRAITDLADANIASVNYHFGSKEGLVRAMFERRLVPINRERLQMLEECTSDGTADLEAIVRAFLTPPLHLLRVEEAANFGRCMVRALSDPGDQMRGLLLEAFRDVVDRFNEELRRALPEDPPEVVFWRFHFMVGALAHTVGMGHLLEEYTGGVCRCSDFEAITERLVRFVTAGMEAPMQAEQTS